MGPLSTNCLAKIRSEATTAPIAVPAAPRPNNLKRRRRAALNEGSLLIYLVSQCSTSTFKIVSRHRYGDNRGDFRCLKSVGYRPYRHPASLTDSCSSAQTCLASEIGSTAYSYG